MSLRAGSRGLPGGSSLVRLLAGFAGRQGRAGRSVAARDIRAQAGAAEDPAVQDEQGDRDEQAETASAETR